MKRAEFASLARPTAGNGRYVNLSRHLDDGARAPNAMIEASQGYTKNPIIVADSPPQMPQRICGGMLIE